MRCEPNDVAIVIQRLPGHELILGRFVSVRAPMPHDRWRCELLHEGTSVVLPEASLLPLGWHDQNAPYQALQAKIDCALLALGAVIKL